MNCMKCGREIEADQVFCPECLAEMEKYPVKPGTVVQLPPQTKPVQSRKPPRRRGYASPEEQVAVLKKQIRILYGAVAVLLAALIGISILLWHGDEEKSGTLPGQNYSAEDTSAPDEPQ